MSSRVGIDLGSLEMTCCDVTDFLTDRIPFALDVSISRKYLLTSGSQAGQYSSEMPKKAAGEGLSWIDDAKDLGAKDADLL